MRLVREKFKKIGRVVAILTDWLLILTGAALIGKAVIAVDVPIARNVIIGLGLVLMGFGLWYRYHRKSKE